MSLNQIFLTAAEVVSRPSRAGCYKHEHIPCCPAISMAGDALRSASIELKLAHISFASYFQTVKDVPFWFGLPSCVAEVSLAPMWVASREEKARVKAAKEQRIYAMLLMAEISKDLY